MAANLAVGAVMVVLVFLLGLLQSMRDTVTKDYLAPPFLATAQSDWAVRIHISKTIIAIFAITLTGSPQIQAIVMLIFYWYMLWVLVRRLPYFNVWVNTVKSGLYGILAWSSLMLLLNVYHVGKATALTNAMLGTIPWGFAMGCGAAFMRYWHVLKVIKAKFTDLPEGNVEIMHKFFDDYECELTARFVLKRDRRGRVAEKTARAADEILKLGNKQFQESAFLALAYSNFLLTVRQNSQSSNAQMTRAGKLPLGWALKLHIFVRNVEEKTKASHKSGDGAMDLISYVEFQQNFKILLSAHTAALKAIRHFWRELLRGDVTFQHLTRALFYMDISESKADRTYQMILERYPKSVKLLRAYGKYLEEVRVGGGVGPG